MSSRLIYHPDHSQVVIEVRFLLLGKSFELPVARWTKLGALRHVKEDKRQYVDNINLFECGWGFQKKAVGVGSLDSVVEYLLGKIWPHRDSFVKFRRKKKLKVTLDCYVQHGDDPPLIGLSASTVKKMAQLDCGIGLDVVRLRTAST